MLAVRHGVDGSRVRTHACELARRNDATQGAQASEEAMNITVYYESDWIVIGDRVCPHSLYEQRHSEAFNGRQRWESFVATGEIPKDCPELKRVCSIKNVAEESP
jgi:hypothetical protein